MRPGLWMYGRPILGYQIRTSNLRRSDGITVCGSEANPRQAFAEGLVRLLDGNRD